MFVQYPSQRSFNAYLRGFDGLINSTCFFPDRYNFVKEWLDAIKQNESLINRSNIKFLANRLKAYTEDFYEDSGITERVNALESLDVTCLRNEISAYLWRHAHHIRCKRDVEGLLQSLDVLNLHCMHAIHYENVTYYFSKSFKYSARFGERPLLFCFVKDEQRNLTAGILWLSKSQACWRKTDKVFPNLIGKSVSGEERLAVPIEINALAYEIHRRTVECGDFQDIDRKEGKRFLKCVIEWSDHDVGHKVEDDRRFFHVKRDSARITPVGAADFSGEDDYKLIAGPRELPVDPDDNDFRAFKKSKRPDFKDLRDSYKYKIKNALLYERLKARVIYSKDRDVRYLFLETKIRGQTYVFLSAAEPTRSPITRHGIHKHWIDLGKLALPFYEYEDQFHPEFFVSDSSYDHAGYKNTGNYLRKIPFIQKYFDKVLKQEIPERL